MRLRALIALALASAVAVAALCNAPRPAEACGGPGYADLGALEPIGAILGRLSWKNDDDFESLQRPELRFLYPFRLETKAALDPLWSFSYPDAGPAPTQPAMNDALDIALRSGNAMAIDRGAGRALAIWLATPPVDGAAQRKDAWRAAEIARVAPHLAKSPAADVRDFFAGRAVPGAPPAALAARTNAEQAASAFEAMDAMFRATIPDGWRDATKNQVSAATWQKLEHAVDAWLARYPAHPLRDYVRLYKERVRYFRGDGDGAWDVLFDVYPRLRVRALAEMRYLLVRGIEPPKTRLDALTDPALVAAFADESRITPARFTRWWKLAEAHPKRRASTNLEERLLLWAARTAAPGKLPSGFPRTAQDPTPLWGKLRAAALIAAARWPAARAELGGLPDDAERALLAAHYFVARSRPDLAAALPKLGADTRQYLLRVLVDDKALVHLSNGATSLARQARFERGVRLAAAGKWRAAATLIQHDDPTHAKRWREVAAIAGAHDADASLRLARFLAEHREALFYEQNPDMYRAFSGRYDPKANPVESSAIEIALARSTPRWLALEAYTRWLEQNPRGAIARSVLDEADDAYNRLTNWAGGNYLFWGTYAPHSALAKRLRRAGRAVRAP